MKAKTIVIGAWCNDRFTARLIDGKGNQIASREPDYVPSTLGIGGGDDIRMEIDLATGQIVGWKTPSEETLKEVFNMEDNDASED